MIQLSGKRIPNVVLGLTIFWLGVTEAFFWTGSFNLHFLPMWVAAIFVGVFMAKSSSDETRDVIFKRLRYNTTLNLPVSDRDAFASKDRGVQSSIGAVPFFRHPLPCLSVVDRSFLIQHLPKELTPAQFNTLFGNMFNGIVPNSGFGRLTERTVRTLCHPDHVNHPAGLDRHGGRSLLTHTLLVTALMLHKAGAYVYDPKRHTANDPDFKLDPNDPLIPALGFLHDIGKLVKFVVDADTQAVTIHADHSSESSRIASDFSEYWSSDISVDDRLLLQDAISYSYSINSLPVIKSTMARPKPTSDRLYALVDFLSSCDVLASSIEMGAGYDFSKDPTFESVQKEADIESVNIFDEFLNFVTIKADINAMNGTKSVGFRYKGLIDDVSMNVIVFDERKFADDFSKFLGKPELSAKEDKRSVITGLVLSALDENGLLIRDPKEVGLRPAKDCLYQMVFAAPNEEGAKAIVLSSAFVMGLDGVERFKTLDKIVNCHSIPGFKHSIYGAKKFSKPTGSTVLERVAMESLGIKPTGQEKKSVDVSTLAESSTPAKVAPSPQPINVSTLISVIRKGLVNKKIIPSQVTNDTSNLIHVVGYNKFFEQLGVPLIESSGDESLALIGIKSVRKSKNNPDHFIFDLCGDIYGNLGTN